MDEKYDKHITNHNKKFDLFVVKNDIKLVFDNNFYSHIKSEFQYSNTIFHMKRFSLNWVESFCERGHNFSHIYEINITAFSNKINMTYECYIKQTIQMVELNLNMIVS